MRRWSRKLLEILDVELSVTGDPPEVEPRTGMVVANHVSWLDIFVISAVSPCRFVAKAEIRRWPVIGYLSEWAGTVFVERSRRHDTARVNGEIRRLLAAGERLAVFPEGTTTDGTELKIFHPSLLQPAVEAAAPVHPTALRYREASGALSRAAPYSGDLSFLGSLRRILREPSIRAEIVFCAPIDSRGFTRHELARASEQAIAAALNLPLPRRRPGTPAGPPGAAPLADLPTRSPYPALPQSR